MEENPSKSNRRSAAAQKRIDASSGLPRDLYSSFRTGTTKSRNGCRVCKIRRIKCDETHPHCTRCTSTGRKCEGYGEAPKRNGSKSPKSPSKGASKVALLPRSGSPTTYTPSVGVQGSDEQRRSFHYFRSRNMSDMPGNFEPYFWDHIVLQLSHRYPTILQSLTALSAIYEQHERLSEQLNVSHALQQYNTAVNALLEYIASDQQDPRVALASCLIFVWIEFLQDNLNSGFQHLDSGLKVLRDLRLSYSQRIQDRDPEDVLGSLDRSFTRLRIQAAVHGSQSDFTTSSTRELEVLEPVPPSFINVFESRNILDKELNAIFGYIRRLQEVGYYSSVDIRAFTTIQAAHLERLSQWQTATRSLVADLESRQDRSQTSGMLYLQLYYTLVNIIWKTMFAGSEMAFDAYTADFETMITICSSLIDDPRSPTVPILSFDMGIIPPLFHLCLKCRVLKLRRRAIALLKQAPEREGMWHRDNIIEYCEWKISIEEGWRGEVEQHEPLPEFARMYAEHVPERGDCIDGRPLMMKFKRGPAGLDIEDLIEVPWGSEMMRHMGNML